jgi:glycosyltransferase involved in cell wall biosynthesis
VAGGRLDRGERKPLKALVVTTVHTPWDARILARQIAAMTAAGWHVTYVAPWPDDVDTPPTIDVVRVPRARGRRRLAAAWSARRAMAALGPSHDLTIVHDPDLVPVALLTSGARPLVWDVHEDTAAAIADRDWVPKRLRRPLRYLLRSLERVAERRCDLMLAERSYASRFTRPHPVVPNVPWRQPTRVPRRDPPRVVYVGRISRSRGFEEMRELGRSLSGSAEVVLVGRPDADVASELEDAARGGELTWLGELPNEAALGEVRGAVAGLSLLRDEPNFRGSMPTKVVEYLASGVPAISTPLPEAVSLLERFPAGTIVPFRSPRKVAETVRELIDDRDRWEAQSSLGFEAVTQHLSWDREAPGFLRFLEGVAARR